MSRDSLGMAGKYTVYQCDDGEGYYFEHEQFGDERAVRVDVEPATKQAFDYEGMYEVPAPCLAWLRANGVGVSEVE
jgi:hypothetical protein